jgi:hypothetical protein
MSFIYNQIYLFILYANFKFLNCFFYGIISIAKQAYNL